MSALRLLVCGTREWSGTWKQIGMHFPDSSEDAVIIHGGCSRVVNGVQVSVDWLAGWIANGLGHIVEPYPVAHDVDGPWPAAGPRRNARMLAKSKPDRGLAFGALWRQHFNGTYFVDWKRTGTGDMVSRMLRARLPVRWIASPGAPAVDLVEMPEPPR